MQTQTLRMHCLAITPKFPKNLCSLWFVLTLLNPPCQHCFVCTCCFLNAAVVRGWLSLDVQQGLSCFLELLHRHLVLSQVPLQLLFSHGTNQNQSWIPTLMELRIPSEGSSALCH